MKVQEIWGYGVGKYEVIGKLFIYKCGMVNINDNGYQLEYHYFHTIIQSNLTKKIGHFLSYPTLYILLNLQELYCMALCDITNGYRSSNCFGIQFWLVLILLQYPSKWLISTVVEIVRLFGLNNIYYLTLAKYHLIAVNRQYKIYNNIQSYTYIFV